jgi:hypothetical protein
MRKFYYGNHFKTKNVTGSSVAAWLSETVLRGHGPGATGFESHRRGRIFSKEGTMCVHDFQGTVGWWKEEKHSFDHHREVGRVRIPAGWATHGSFVVIVLCVVQKKEKTSGEGGRGWPGKVARSPAAPPKKGIRRPQGTR